jgi:uncharacterized membrane protein YphA (DoxX/SURF4 family)
MITFVSFSRWWDDFFFGKTDAAALCIFRIIFGLFLILNGISLIEDFDAWFGVGDNALVPLADSLKFYSNLRLNIYRWLSPTEGAAWLVLLGYIVSSLFVMIGFKTRVSALICFFFMVSMQNRNFAILNSGDTLMRCLLFLLIFAPSHVRYSVDAILSKIYGTPLDPIIPRLTIRLLQLQFSLVYLATTLFKLKGLDWVDGTAVYYTSRLVNFQRIVLPVVFDVPILVQLATWTALFVEFAMGFLIWIRELRIWVLIAGILLHLLIEVSMSIGFFEWVMMSAYILFLERHDLETARQLWVRNFHRLQKFHSAA